MRVAAVVGGQQLGASPSILAQRQGLALEVSGSSEQRGDRLLGGELQVVALAAEQMPELEVPFTGASERELLDRRPVRAKPLADLVRGRGSGQACLRALGRRSTAAGKPRSGTADR